jgi:hypothetical protein
VVAGVKICSYVGHFRYGRDGVAVVDDVKGVRTAVYRLKRKLAEAFHPGLTITEIPPQERADHAAGSTGNSGGGGLGRHSPAGGDNDWSANGAVALKPGPGEVGQPPTTVIYGVPGTLRAILGGHRTNRIEQPMPWRFILTSSLAA